MLIKDKDIIELQLSSSQVLKISSHECLSLWGQWLMEYLHSQRDTLWESKAWWLEPHSKEMDKGPEDSCRAALSLTNKKKTQNNKKQKKGRTAREKYLDLKFTATRRHGKGK